MDKINKLQAVIDELRLESRKIEYSSALERYLDDCIQYDDKMKFKRAYNEIIDYGGFQKVFKVLDFTDSQITNWSNRISTVREFSNA